MVMLALTEHYQEFYLVHVFHNLRGKRLRNHQKFGPGNVKSQFRNLRAFRSKLCLSYFDLGGQGRPPKVEQVFDLTKNCQITLCIQKNPLEYRVT